MRGGKADQDKHINNSPFFRLICPNDDTTYKLSVKIL
jgi:hypothetical protein